MRAAKWVVLFLICFAFSGAAARAQAPCTTSPNLGFALPNIGNTTNWGLCINNDLTLLDNLLGGTNTLPTGTTPAISARGTYITANTGSTTITNFLDGYPGQSIKVICGTGDTGTSIAASANISISATWSCPNANSLILTLNGAVWVASGGGSSGGSGSAGGVYGDVQTNNGSGGFNGGTQLSLLTQAGNTQIFTNKNFDTGATGNIFKVNGTQISSVTGTGVTVVLQNGPTINNPTFVNPILGAAIGTSLSLGLGTPLTSTNQTGNGPLCMQNGCQLNVPISASPYTGLADAPIITWAVNNASTHAKVTLAGNRLLNVSGLQNGVTYVLQVTQDATGSRTLSQGTGCIWSRGWTLQTTPNVFDIIGWIYDGSTGTCDVIPPNGSLPTQYTQLECAPGLGDGLNAIPGGTYVQFNCVNKSGVQWTINSISCYTNNNGSSTLAAANNAGTALLTGPVTCTNTKTGGGAVGTQSATTTLANNDAITFTFAADGTSTTATWTVSLSQ